MKTITLNRNSLITGICSIIFGSLLIYFKGQVVNFILIIAGIVLLIWTIIDFAKFYKETEQTQNRWSNLPVSIFFTFITGLLLIILPALWVTITEIIIALVVIILAISRFSLLYGLHKDGIKSVGWVHYILPTLMILLAVFTIFYPEYMLNSLFLIFGITIVIYGVSDIINYFIIKNRHLTDYDI